MNSPSQVGIAGGMTFNERVNMKRRARDRQSQATELQRMVVDP